MHDQKQLHEIALDYPWYMFTGEEIAELCNVSQNVISRVKAMSDSPFFLNKCRPEWFLEWMRNHPEFQLTKGYAPEFSGSAGKAPSVLKPVANKPSISTPDKRIRPPKQIARRRPDLKR